MGELAALRAIFFFHHNNYGLSAKLPAAGRACVGMELFDII